jgi:recombinational DNA repair ATPase RecF
VLSLKSSFERLNSEYEAVVKKRQALNNLFSSGRISQSTFNLFDKEMEETLAEIEKRREALLEKMAAKTKEVEEQIRVLERLLANYEIQHVGGEIEEETYQKETALLSIGLENAKQELNVIKETMEKLANFPQTAEKTVSKQIAVPEAVAEADVGKVEVETVEIKTEAETQALTENPPEAQLTETKTEGETTGN